MISQMLNLIVRVLFIFLKRQTKIIKLILITIIKLYLANIKHTQMHTHNKISQSLAVQALKEQLNSLSAPEAYKNVIKERAGQVERNVYWYFTNHQSEYLRNIWDKEINQKQIVKNRIKKITDDAFKQIQFEIGLGRLTRPGQDNHVERIGNLTIEQIVQRYSPEKTNFNSFGDPKTKQVQEKLKHINQDKQKFMEKIVSIKKKNQQKRLQQQQELKQARKREQEEKKQRYKSQVQKKLEQQKRHEQQRKKQNQKFKIFLKEYKTSKPLHVLMQQEYFTKFQLPQLQEKQRQMSERTKKHVKPTLQQLNRHDQQYINRKVNKPEKAYITNHTIDVGYKSKFYEKQARKLAGLESEQEQGLYDFMQKKKRYSQFVKQKFKPKIKVHASVDKTIQNSRASQSIQGQQQIVNSSAKLARKKKFRDVVLQAPDRSRYIEVGNNYLQYVKQLQKKNRNLHSSQSPSSKQLEERIHYHNYLEDFKYEHRELHKGLGSNWEKDLYDQTVTSVERRDRVLVKSKQLEERAIREQQFINLSTHARPSEVIAKKGKADDILIQSIRAKVAVLKDVVQPK